MNKRHQFWIGDVVTYRGTQTKITGIQFDQKTGQISFNVDGVKESVRGEDLERVGARSIKNVGSVKRPVTR